MCVCGRVGFGFDTPWTAAACPEGGDNQVISAMNSLANLFRGAPVTRALVITSVALSGLGFILRSNGKPTPLLAMVPAFALWHPWTFLTAGLHESNIISVLIPLRLPAI